MHLITNNSGEQNSRIDGSDGIVSMKDEIPGMYIRTI